MFMNQFTKKVGGCKLRIYILFESHWTTNEGEAIIGIFLSKEKAEQECKRLNGDRDYPYFVEEYKVTE